MATTFGMRGMRAFAVATAAAAFAVPALADIVGPGLVISAQDAAGNYCQTTFAVTQDTEGNWHWASDEPHEMWDINSNVLVATINPAGTPGSSVEYVEDPIVNLNFSVAAGASTTNFMIGSALLTFPVINSAQGRASATYTTSDTTGDGAVLTPTAGNSGLSGYAAAHNGFAGPGPSGPNQFTELLSSLSAAPFGSDGDAALTPPVGYTPIGVPVSSMSSFIGFQLSAFDLASGTSSFEIIPEPASLLLLVVGAGLIRRR